jgi:hypothetical protein
VETAIPGTIPVPLRLTTDGLVGASLTTVNAPEAVPVAVGV